MKVKELKARLAGVPDDAEVLLSVNGGHEGMFDDVVQPGIRGRTRSVRLWGDRYQTREVNNAYGCNDDRYGGPAFNIEVGNLSD